MSKVYDCPVCGENTCVTDYMELNYCAYCGNSVNGNWRYAYGIHESKSLQAKELSPASKKTKKTEQISLFNVNEYRKPQAGKGLYY